MTIFSWNVNGIRAVVNKGAFAEFITKYQPDILGLQETKATKEQVYELFGVSDKLHLDEMQGEAENRSKAYKSYAARESQASTQQIAKSKIKANGLAGSQNFAVQLSEYSEYWGSAKKKGYSGTAIFSNNPAINVTYGLPAKIATKYNLSDTYGDTTTEGRITTAEYKDFYYVTVYTPNSKGDLSRLNLRHSAWDPAFYDYIMQLEQSKPVIFSGDLNVAHGPDDLANPKSNIGKHGYTDEERAGLQKIIDAGFIDTFRHFTPTGNGYYTWWTHWANARARNVGWRIDYFFISPRLLPKLKSAKIYPDVLGSDHCPVSIEIN